MATVPSKRQCPLCRRWISKCGFAWASHRRACVRRGGKREEKRKWTWMVMRTGWWSWPWISWRPESYVSKYRVYFGPFIGVLTSYHGHYGPLRHLLDEDILAQR